MHRVTNLSSSPYTLQTAAGPVVLAAKSDVTAEFDAAYLKHLKVFTAVRVDPVDGDSFELRERYESLAGKPADKRWSDKRLADEIAKMEAPQ